MGLPVIQHRHAPSDSDLLRLFHHSESRYVESLADTAPLDVGTAYANPKLPAVYDANHIRDVALPPDMSPQEAIQLVDTHFARAGTRCAYWVMNPSAPANPMADHLLSLGYTALRSEVMLLRRLSRNEVPAPPGLSIIPARASYRHVRSLVEESMDGQPQFAEAAVLHLDDPQWSELLALRDGQAIARVGVLAVGEVGRIGNLYVAAASRRQGVGRFILWHILQLCVRATFRHVMLSVRSDNTPAIELYRSVGFETIGSFARYTCLHSSTNRVIE